MKCTVVIDPHNDEEVIVHAHSETELTRQIRSLCEQRSSKLIGYQDREATLLTASNICCFVVEHNHVFAICPTERYDMKCRLYELETRLPAHFLKINQSCIANMQHIKRFDASLAGSLRVIFSNGYTDFVSRRQLKAIKERFGLT